MTELVILRCIVIGSIIWFLLSEYLHQQQLTRSYRNGFARALSISFDDIQSELKVFLKEYADDLKIVVGAIEREQSDEARTGEKRET